MHCAPENPGVGAELVQVQSVVILAAAEMDAHQQSADELGDDGGHGHAHDAHAELENEEQVQEDVEDAADHEEIQRPPGISNGS